jgi:hypothetical protein
MPYPHAEAAGLYESGILQRRTGEAAQAWEPLEQGLTIFRTLGARPAAERTEQALYDLG